MHGHALCLLRTISRSESESLPLFAPITILACGWVCGAHRMRRCAWPASSTVTLIGRSGRHNGPRPQSSCQLPVGRPLAAASGRHWHCIHWQLKLKPGPTTEPTNGHPGTSEATSVPGDQGCCLGSAACLDPRLGLAAEEARATPGWCDGATVARCRHDGPSWMWARASESSPRPGPARNVS